MTETQDSWPAGATWVFQGTVAEDGTGGTHVCSLTVTPGQGQELQVLYGKIINGNTATSQTMSAIVDDGTNGLVTYIAIADTSALIERSFPSIVAPAANNNQRVGTVMQGSVTVSGTMRLVLSVSTAAISVTHTFAVVCRLKTSALPTATLADTVGTPVLTVNTNRVF